VEISPGIDVGVVLARASDEAGSMSGSGIRVTGRSEKAVKPKMRLDSLPIPFTRVYVTRVCVPEVLETRCKTTAAMTSKKTPPTPFAARLYEARRASGLTQVQLAEKIGSTQRAISYYESTTGLPPVPVLVDLAKALDVSTDDLLGLAPASAPPKAKKESPAERRLWKKFQQVLRLPAKDQRAVIRLINSVALAQPEKKRARSA